MSGNLVLLILMSIGEVLMALGEDVLEHSEDSLDRALVGEVLGKGQHNLDHLGPFGFVGEVFEELLDVVLRFGDLNERGTVSELTNEVDALVEGGDGSVKLFDILLIVTVISGSLSFGISHILIGGIDQVVVAGDLIGKLVDQWDKDVVDVVGGLSDIGLGR